MVDLVRMDRGRRGLLGADRQTYFDILGDLDATHRVGGRQQEERGVASGGVLKRRTEGKMQLINGALWCTSQAVNTT